MSEKTFLVTMRKTCDYMLNYAGKKKCTKYRLATPLCLCDGNLKKRPLFCPLVELEQRQFMSFGLLYAVHGDDKILYAEIEK